MGSGFLKLAKWIIQFLIQIRITIYLNIWTKSVEAPQTSSIIINII